MAVSSCWPSFIPRLILLQIINQLSKIHLALQNEKKNLPIPSSTFTKGQSELIPMTILVGDE
jgi:hypothetical protein